MIVKQNGNAIEIAFKYDPSLVSFIKGLERRRYNAGTKTWFIPLQGSLEVLKRLSERGFNVDKELWSAVKQDTGQAREVEALAVMDDTEFTTPLPLYPFQKVGAAFLWKVGSGLLGDEMGLGKTIQALALCEKTKAEKVLVFCPAAVKWQWAEEIKRFMKPTGFHYEATVPSGKMKDLPDIIVIKGTKKERCKLWHIDTRFYIANYELLLRDFDEINAREWDIIIADEATRISNPQAKQSKRIKNLRAKRRIAMTGTPISNRANELWNIIDFCYPGVLGSYWEFLQRYCLKNQWGGIFGYQNMDELRNKLKRYMIRRLKVDVLPELPEKISTDVPFELSEKEKALYKKLKKEILFEIEQTDISKLEQPMTIQYTLVKMVRLRQLTDSMELLGENKTSSKLEVLKELLQENVENERKAIVFTQFAEMADILERELTEWQPLKISGRIKEEYGTVVEKFNRIEKHKVLIMTSAGQWGLNIQRASVIFHFDQEWSLAKMKQREGRAHRIGQKDTVMVYNLLAKGSIDYYIKKILFGKAELSSQLLDDKPIGIQDIKEMLTYD